MQSCDVDDEKREKEIKFTNRINPIRNYWR
jgi:hypothetical protein